MFGVSLRTVSHWNQSFGFRCWRYSLYICEGA